jgi:hypothetical protein
MTRFVGMGEGLCNALPLCMVTPPSDNPVAQFICK